MRIQNQADEIFDKVDYKYSQYSKLQMNCHSYMSSCFVYNMGLYVFDKNYNTRDVTKFRGYYYNDSYKCMEPLNYRIGNSNRTSCFLALNIYLLDFITQEIIDNIDINNNNLIHYDIHN